MNWLKNIAYCAFFILFLLVVTSKSDSYFINGDESGYFANLATLDKYGISIDFLKHFSGMAGPLHPIIHWLLRPFTGAIPPGVRVINITILCFLIWHFRTKNSYRILFVPMTFICAGYAMTELPAMLFLTLSIACLEKKWLKYSILNICFSGICLSLAIAGRWNYLALLPIFYLWIFLTQVEHKWLIMLAFIAFSLVCPIWIMSAWGGINPPEVQAFAEYETFHILPQNLILSACFASLMVLMLAPSWFFSLQKYWKIFTYLSISVFVVNFIFKIYHFLPAKSIFWRIATVLSIERTVFEQYIGNVFGSLSIVLGLVFFFCLAIFAWQRRQDYTYLFYAACTSMILLTSIKITHIFSSRYPYQTLPFLLLLVAYDAQNHKKTWWEYALAIAGVGWGIATWVAYQYIEPQKISSLDLMFG